MKGKKNEKRISFLSPAYNLRVLDRLTCSMDLATIFHFILLTVAFEIKKVGV